jgi:hypothetical protein
MHINKTVLIVCPKIGLIHLRVNKSSVMDAKVNWCLKIVVDVEFEVVLNPKISKSAIVVPNFLVRKLEDSRAPTYLISKLQFIV